MTALRAELAEKSAVYSPTHPDVVRLKAQIKALETVTVPMAPVAVATQGGYSQGPSGNQLLDPLLLQRLGVQQNLENTSQKLAAAQRGENLERDQYSERLQILNKPCLRRSQSSQIVARLLLLHSSARLWLDLAG